MRLYGVSHFILFWGWWNEIVWCISFHIVFGIFLMVWDGSHTDRETSKKIFKTKNLLNL